MPYSTSTKYLLKQVGIDIHSWAPTSPISLKKLCSNFHLKFKNVPLDHNTCGMLVRSAKGNYIIVNANHPYTRRRFSTAHEIGHFFLGHDSDISTGSDQNRFEEIQANKYASCLLMPDELFHRVHRRSSTVKEMANWLRVSPISVAIRCLQFGYRRIEAETVKNEYFNASTGVEVTKILTLHKENHFVNEKNGTTYEPYTIVRNFKRNESLWKRNTEMIERYRRMLGYE